MKLPRPFLFAAATLAFVIAAPFRAEAQEQPAAASIDPVMPRGSDGKPVTDRNVKIDVAVTIKGTDKPVVKSLSMVTGDGRQAQGRAQVILSVLFGRSQNQKDVGINVDATPRILANGKLTVRLKFNFNTVYRVDTPEGPMPSFGNGGYEMDGIVFESGKPLIVTQGTDAETGREYSVQVTATIVK
jgi:hypothetical protein